MEPLGRPPEGGFVMLRLFGWSWLWNGWMGLWATFENGGEGGLAVKAGPHADPDGGG